LIRNVLLSLPTFHQYFHIFLLHQRDQMVLAMKVEMEDDMDVNILIQTAMEPLVIWYLATVMETMVVHRFFFTALHF
jgi:hypothetical protein